MFVAFNLRRIINIIGFDKLKTWLKSLFFQLLEAFCRLFRPFSPGRILQPKINVIQVAGVFSLLCCIFGYREN
jgi:hypothetical protein